MGVFYCQGQGCNTYQDSKECERYIHTIDAEYCSDECAPVMAVWGSIAANLKRIGQPREIEEGVFI